MDSIWPLPGNSPWRRRREKPRSRPRPRPRDRPPYPARPQRSTLPAAGTHRGSPRLGGRHQLRVLLGLVVCKVGGGVTRTATSGGPGALPEACCEYLGSCLSAQRRGVLQCAIGVRPSKLTVPTGSCKCTGTTTSRRVHVLQVLERAPQSLLPVPWVPPDALSRS